MTWLLEAPPKTRRPEALSDLSPLLDRLVEAFGNNRLAAILNVSPGTVTNWSTGKRPIVGDHVQHLLDLHDVMTRALQIMDASVISDWLEGNEPFLNYARPIDVLALHGSGPLLSALRGVASSASA